jgi:two-component system chemotaxis response regulator CheY
MIVDDNVEFSEGLQTLLKDRYEVITVGSGEDAVKAYRRNMPDMVLMDLVLPTMGGVEAMEEILFIDPDANIITISGEKGKKSELLEQGAKDFIPKPINISSLLASIEMHIDKVTVNILRQRVYTLETGHAELKQDNVDLKCMIEQQNMVILRVAQQSRSVVDSFKGSLSSGKKGILVGGYLSSILITALSFINYDSGILNWIVSNPLVILLIFITLGLTGFWVVPMLIKKRKKKTVTDENRIDYAYELEGMFSEKKGKRGEKGKNKLI